MAAYSRHRKFRVRLESWLGLVKLIVAGMPGRDQWRRAMADCAVRQRHYQLNWVAA
jgi:hypothetical protein